MKCCLEILKEQFIHSFEQSILGNVSRKENLQVVDEKNTIEQGIPVIAAHLVEFEASYQNISSVQLHFMMNGLPVIVGSM